MLWDQRTGKATLEIEDESSNVRHMVVSRDGQRALTASATSSMAVWNLESGACETSKPGGAHPPPCVSHGPARAECVWLSRADITACTFWLGALWRGVRQYAMSVHMTQKCICRKELAQSDSRLCASSHSFFLHGHQSEYRSV